MKSRTRRTVVIVVTVHIACGGAIFVSNIVLRFSARLPLENNAYSPSAMSSRLMAMNAIVLHKLRAGRPRQRHGLACAVLSCSFNGIVC